MNVNEMSDLARSRIDSKHRKELGIMTVVEREEKTLTQSERKLQAQIADFLRVKDIVFCQQRMDRKSNVMIGWPDFVFAYLGHPVALEVKVGKNNPTPEQESVAMRMKLNGWWYRVVRNLHDVRDVLTEIER